MSGHKLTKEHIRAYTLAGNATITLQSLNTNARYTYKIVKSKDNDNLFFIHLLRGPNNEEDYTYIGCYYDDTGYFHPAKAYKYIERRVRPKSVQAIEYFFKHLDMIPANLNVYHAGKCGRCGRKLTTPESIMLGFGPECKEFVRQ